MNTVSEFKAKIIDYSKEIKKDDPKQTYLTEIINHLDSLEIQMDLDKLSKLMALIEQTVFLDVKLLKTNRQATLKVFLSEAKKPLAEGVELESANIAKEQLEVIQKAPFEIGLKSQRLYNILTEGHQNLLKVHQVLSESKKQSVSASSSESNTIQLNAYEINQSPFLNWETFPLKDNYEVQLKDVGRGVSIGNYKISGDDASSEKLKAVQEFTGSEPATKAVLSVFQTAHAELIYEFCGNCVNASGEKIVGTSAKGKIHWQKDEGGSISAKIQTPIYYLKNLNTDDHYIVDPKTKEMIRVISNVRSIDGEVIDVFRLNPDLHEYLLINKQTGGVERVRTLEFLSMLNNSVETDKPIDFALPVANIEGKIALKSVNGVLKPIITEYRATINTPDLKPAFNFQNIRYDKEACESSQAFQELQRNVFSGDSSSSSQVGAVEEQGSVLLVNAILDDLKENLSFPAHIQKPVLVGIESQSQWKKESLDQEKNHQEKLYAQGDTSIQIYAIKDEVDGKIYVLNPENREFVVANERVKSNLDDQDFKEMMPLITVSTKASIKEIDLQGYALNLESVNINAHAKEAVLMPLAKKLSALEVSELPKNTASTASTSNTTTTPETPQKGFG